MKPLIKILVLFVLLSCQDVKKETSTVRVRIESFPESINYLTAASQVGTEIQRKTFNMLLYTDEELRIKPLSVKSLPAVTKVDLGYAFEYEIKSEAFWDDGTPITSRDIAFSIKTFKLPLEANQLASVYYHRLKDVKIDSLNEKKFTIIGEGNSNDLLGLSGDFGILQKNKFDPNGILDSISFLDISNNIESIKSNKAINGFFENFTKDGFTFNDQFFSSSGPYQIDKIEPGLYINLTQNKNWWGKSKKQSDNHIDIFPDKIIYYSIPETLNAIQSLKSGNIDVMDNISANEFEVLQKDKLFIKKFNTFSPNNFRLTFIGLNSRQKLLTKKGFRKAISHLIPRKALVSAVEKGYATLSVGPINPSLTYYYNSTIKPYKYDVPLAQELLSNNGFTKREGNWYNKNENEPIELSMIYKQNSDSEAIAQILKFHLEKFGLRLNTTALNSSTFYKKIDSRDFDIYIGTLTGSPFSLNFSPLFSTQASSLGGYNDTGFGNAKSDSLIRVVNFAQDSTERRGALFGLQEMLHDEATMLFLYFSQNKIAISKKFTNLQISSMKPGYDVTAFKLTKELE